jgi:hypothetical protein
MVIQPADRRPSSNRSFSMTIGSNGSGAGDALTKQRCRGFGVVAASTIASTTGEISERLSSKAHPIIVALARGIAVHRLYRGLQYVSRQCRAEADRRHRYHPDVQFLELQIHFHRERV